jgi:predicted Zn-dependent protease
MALLEWFFDMDKEILITRFGISVRWILKHRFIKVSPPDSTFYVEKGDIKHPITNLRFKESCVAMLNNLEALGRPERKVRMQYSLMK